MSIYACALIRRSFLWTAALVLLVASLTTGTLFAAGHGPTGGLPEASSLSGRQTPGLSVVAFTAANGEGAQSVGISEENDATPGVTLDPEILWVLESGTKTYEVTLTSEPTGDVTINLTTTGDITLNKTSLTFTSANWNAPQTVTVSGVNDNKRNCISFNTIIHGAGCPEESRGGGGVRAASIAHTVSAVGSDYEDVTAPDLVVGVRDDELPRITVQDHVETTEGQPLVFTLALSDSTTRTWYEDITFEVYTGDPSEITPAHRTKYPREDYPDATPGDDYIPISQAAAVEYTLRAGEESLTHSVSTKQDELDEHKEAFALYVDKPVNALVDFRKGGLGIILDDDDTPAVSVGNATAVTEGHDPDTTVALEFPLTLSKASGRDVIVHYTLGGTATAGADYTDPAAADEDEPNVKKATINAGSKRGAITIPVKGDRVHEDDETVTVTLRDTDSATVSTRDGENTGQGRITDDDDAPTAATLSVSPGSVGESAGAITVMVTAMLDGETTFDVDTTVRVSVGKEGDSAVSGTDYSGVEAFDLTIQATESSGKQTFSLAPTGDALDEDNENLTVHAMAQGLTISDAEVTITDDDEPSVLSIADAAPVTEGSDAEFTVTLTPASGRVVAVQWRTDDDESDGVNAAAAGTDYKAELDGQMITFNPGDTSAVVSVATVEDTMHEPAETFLVQLSQASNGTLATADAIGTGTINDDDPLPTAASVTLDPTKMGEGDGDTDVTVMVTLGGYSTFAEDQTISVSVGQDGDSAVSGTDYTGVEAFDLNISSGQSSGEQDFTLTLTDDNLDEDDETLTVRGTVAGLTISDATLTIEDDDTRGVEVLSTALTLDEDGSAGTYTVVLASQPTGDVSVTLTRSGDDSGAITVINSLTFTPSNWNSAQTVTVTPVDDETASPNGRRVVTIKHAVSGADYGAETADDVVVTVNDDELPELTIDNVTVDEGAIAQFTITLAPVWNQGVTVQWSTGDDGSDGANQATVGEDYAAQTVPQTVTIAAGETAVTVSVQTADDQLDEHDETFLVNLSAPTGAILGAASAGRGTITDDDATSSTVSVGHATAVTEGNDPDVTVNLQFPLTLSEASGRDVTVIYTLGGSATSGSDYTDPVPKTATIAAGDTTGNIVIPVKGDLIAEGNEIVIVTLSGADYATLGALKTATGTITDNDAAPTTGSLSVNPISVDEDAGATTVTVTATLVGSVTLTADTTVRVIVGKDGDTAVSDTDYTGVSAFDLTISAGETSGEQTFTLTPTNDALDEDDEKLTVHATAGGLTIADAEVTITDANSLPELTIGGASVVEGGKAAFTVTLTPASGREVTVQWTTGDDPAENAAQATADTDYTAQTTASILTIAAGGTSGTIEVQTVQDILAEGSETFVVNLASPTNATLGPADSGIGTITDDDTAATRARLAVSPVSVNESAGATTVAVTVMLGGSVAFTEDTTVRVMVGRNGDTAVSGADYTAVSAFDLTISAGATSGEKTFSLTPTVDALDEDNENLTVHATADGLIIADAEVTINDDDALPVLTIADAAAVDEGDDPNTTVDMEFRLTMEPVSGRDVTVTYTLAGTAAGTSDYILPHPTTAIIPAGQTDGNIAIEVKGDRVYEGDETVIVTLTEASHATLGTPSTGTGVITDNKGGQDQGGLINVGIDGDTAVTEGDWAHFWITLSEPLTEAVQVPIGLDLLSADPKFCEGADNILGQVLCLDDLVPHQSLLGPDHADVRNHSYIPSPAKPWLLNVPAGSTTAYGSIGTRRDVDGENERFRIVLDTAADEFRNFNVYPGDDAFVEVIVVDEASYPVAGRWWARLDEEARVRMVSAAASSFWQLRLNEDVAKPFMKLRPEYLAHAGALVGELVDAESSGADKTVDLATPQSWWGSLDCRLRRIAVGEGVAADTDSPWCKEWDDGDSSGRLNEPARSVVGDIFEAVTGTIAIDERRQMSPQSSEPVDMPLTAVSNVQVVADADGSVTVTWDAVDHATSYTVEYTGASSGPQQDLDASPVVVSGVVAGIIGTTATIQHGATGSMTIRVTVTPAYVDGNGDTQLLNRLAGTATLEVVFAEPDPPVTCNLPADAITVADVTGWRDALDATKAAAGVKRWNRVLEALGEDTGAGVSAMTAEQARAVANWLKNGRWERTTRTLEALERCDALAPTPEISIAAGAGVVEGADVTFTVTATPPPSADLPVSVTVSQSGDYGATIGAQIVAIPTGGSYTLTVATGDDRLDETDGSVTVTIDTGTGYTVSTTAGTATVVVSDNDVPVISIASDGDVTEGSDARFIITANPAPAAALSVSLSVSQSGDYGVTTGAKTVTIPTSGSYTLTVATSDDSDDEADGSVTATVNTGAGYTVSATAGAATVAVADDDDPPQVCNLPNDAITVAEVTGWRDALDPTKAAAGIKRWNRVLATFGEDTGEKPMTAELARQVADWLGNTRWDRTARTLEAMAQCDD